MIQAMFIFTVSNHSYKVGLPTIHIAYGNSSCHKLFRRIHTSRTELPKDSQHDMLQTLANRVLTLKFPLFLPVVYSSESLPQSSIEQVHSFIVWKVLTHG